MCYYRKPGSGPAHFACQRDIKMAPKRSSTSAGSTSSKKPRKTIPSEKSPTPSKAAAPSAPDTNSASDVAEAPGTAATPPLVKHELGDAASPGRSQLEKELEELLQGEPGWEELPDRQPTLDMNGFSMATEISPGTPALQEPAPTPAPTPAVVPPTEPVASTAEVEQPLPGDPVQSMPDPVAMLSNPAFLQGLLSLLPMLQQTLLTGGAPIMPPPHVALPNVAQMAAPSQGWRP